FRFHAHFGRGDPDAAGFAACRKLSGLLPDLSGERVAAELRRLLAASDPAQTIERMSTAGVLAPLLPEIADLARLRGLQGLAEPAASDPLLRLASVLPEDATVARAVAERLRLSN